MAVARVHVGPWQVYFHRFFKVFINFPAKKQAKGLLLPAQCKRAPSQLRTGRRMEEGSSPAWGRQGNLGPSFGRNAEIAGARRG